MNGALSAVLKAALLVTWVVALVVLWPWRRRWRDGA
jgi:hypothetical protein